MNEKLIKITYEYEDEEAITLFVLFTKFKILKTRDEVQIRVAEEFEFLLNDLDKNFTRYELEDFVNLASKHSKTLYRVLKQWRTQGLTKEYKTDDLKALFECETMENKIFLRDVIKPAMAELESRNLFVNIKCEAVKARKRGAPVIGYKFSFAREQVLREPQKKAIEYKEAGTYVPTKKISNNKFNNFEQRDYTKAEMDNLERLLLSTNKIDNAAEQTEFNTTEEFDERVLKSLNIPTESED